MKVVKTMKNMKGVSPASQGGEAARGLRPLWRAMKKRPDERPR